MRRIILLITAFLVTFGVFANGPMTATAPSLASVFGHFDSSAIKETAVSYIMPKPAAMPATPAKRAAAAERVKLGTDLHMAEIETIDLGNGLEFIPAAREFDGTFDKDGWVTLSYGEPAMPEAVRAEIPMKSGSRAMSRAIFTRDILEKPTQVHRSADRNSARPQGRRSLFEPLLAQLRIESSDGRGPAMKFDRKPVQRTIAKQRIASASHTIVFSEAVETAAEIGTEDHFGTIKAFDRPVFLKAAMAIEPEEASAIQHNNGPDIRQLLSASAAREFVLETSTATQHNDGPEIRQLIASQAAREFVPEVAATMQHNDGAEVRQLLSAPAAREFVSEMAAVTVHNDTVPVARLLEANADKTVFTATVPAVPARIISADTVSAVHQMQFSATAPIADVIDLAVAPKAEKPSGSRVGSGVNKGEIFAKAKSNIFTSRDVISTVSHPIVAVTEPVTAPVESTPAKIAEPEFAGAHNDPGVWLSSYATTSPEFTAASLERPKAVTLAPKRAAVAITGMTTLNVAPMKRAADGSYCDSNFIGEPIRFSQTAVLTLEDLLLQIHNRFGINFIVGTGVASRPMNIKAGSIPWNVLLKSQLFISGVRARCIDQNTIELVENAGLSSLQDMADVETRFLKLKFLQRTTNSAVGLSGQSQSSQSGGQSGCGNGGGGQSGGSSGGGGGGGQGGGQNGETAAQLGSSKFDKLIIEIEKILGLRSMQESSVGSMGGQGGQGGMQQQQTEAIRSNRYVTQVPGRNILAIRATKEEHELIDQIIARADRPPFQVVIKGLVYTANQDRLQDIGVQTSITGGTADGRVNGGIFGPSGGIVSPFFDFSAMVGTFDFNVQVTAFQQNGVISIKSRPFATVVDGLCTTLDVGKTILIPIDGGVNGTGTLEEREATNTLAVAPYVVDDENGNPVAVTLDLTLTANELDETTTTRGVPAISTRSISTQLLLEKDQTAILGGFTVDQDRRSVSKTPGLGDIPLLGELFKRRVKDLRVQRLYFAITASVIRYGDAIRPADVPGATTDPPSITPEQKLRSDKAEPKQVKGP